MSLSDPFSTTYEGAYKSGLSLGEGINTAAKGFGMKSAQDNKLKKTSDMLKQFGILKQEEPSYEDYKNTANDFMKKSGQNIQIETEGKSDEEKKIALRNIFKAAGIPEPKSNRVTLDANRAAETGMEYDADTGDLKFKPSKNLYGLGLMQGEVPDGFEVTGYDQKGKPMLRKIKRDVSAEKLDIENAEKEDLKKQKTQLVLDSAKDTLATITDVEKGIDNFGMFGNVPSIPGTSRKTWEANIDKLLSSKIINTITSMKDASKTGATGFGQLTEKELGVLQKASTALKKDLPKEDAQKYINDIKSAVKNIIEKKSEGMTEDFSTMSDDELRRIAGGG